MIHFASEMLSSSKQIKSAINVRGVTCINIGYTFNPINLGSDVGRCDFDLYT